MKAKVRESFRRQAEWCERLGSPFTALACRSLGERLTEQTAFGARLPHWPGSLRADLIALRACGALNALAREGHPALTPLYPPDRLPTEDEFWLGAQVAIAKEDGSLTEFLDSAPQTNEVARSATLLPRCLEIARRTGLPLAIREIGASAGSNLLFDRHFYQYGSFTWGVRDANVTALANSAARLRSSPSRSKSPTDWDAISCRSTRGTPPAARGCSPVSGRIRRRASPARKPR